MSDQPTDFIPETPSSTIELTAAMRSDMHSTARWSRTVGIIGLIVCVLGTIMSLIAFYAFSNTGIGASGYLNTMLFVFAYFVVVLLFYIFICIVLMRYSTHLEGYATQGSISHLEDFSVQQRRLWRTIGITTVCFMIIYFVGIFLIVVPN